MLEIVEYGKDEYAFPSLIVLGCFDAIHAGHRELFKKAKLQAKINGLDLGVMMFRDGKGGRQIYSFEERLPMLMSYNVKFVLVIDYTPEFKQIMPLDFLASIEEKINVKAYMSGKDFRFGKGAKGKSSTLKNYAEDEDNGVWYMPVKDVVSDGEKISTTLIKSCLDRGDVMRASALLGENFFVEGCVTEGAHRGTDTLGFPTVNILYPEWKYPVKHGVYKVCVDVDGASYSGIANFGGRPTFNDNTEALEVHIKDFEGDLYGKMIKVSFVGYMRAIHKFESAEALAAQLCRDKAALDLSDQQFASLYPEDDEAAAVQPVAEELSTHSVPCDTVPEPVASEEETEAVTEAVTSEEVIEAVTEPVISEEQTGATAEPVPSEEVTEVVPEPEISEEETEAVTEPVTFEEVTEVVPEAEIFEEEAEAITESVTSEEVTEVVPEAEISEEEAEAITESVPSEEDTEISEEVLSTDDIAENAVVQDIIPAWKLLDEPADYRLTEFSSDVSVEENPVSDEPAVADVSEIQPEEEQSQGEDQESSQSDDSVENND